MGFEKTDLQNEVEKALSSGNIQVLEGNPIDILNKLAKKENIKNKKKNDLELKYNILLEKQNTMENYLDSLNINDNFDGLLDFLKILYENKKEFLEFLNIKKNNFKKENIMESIDFKSSLEYIEIKNSNEELMKNNKLMEKQIEDLNITIKNLNSKLESFSINNNDDNINNSLLNEKIKIALEEQELIFSQKIEKINIAHKKEIDKIIEIKNKNFNKNKKLNIDEKKNNKDYLPLPDNLNEVIYYRYIKNSYSYYIFEGKKHLQCCNTKYDNKEISHTNFITCYKCFRTYNLSEDVDKNNLHTIFVKILPEHIISNEKEIYNKIKCNICNYIDKKEIDFCFRCKKLKKAEIIIPEKFPSKEESGYKTVKSFAYKTLNTVKYNANIYQTALDEGINVYEMKPLIKYIKENNLMEEKQNKIIINKIIRSHAILHIFNDNKYLHIKDIIERIFFDIKAVSKLDENQWTIFRNILITKLDNELDNYNKNKNN